MTEEPTFNNEYFMDCFSQNDRSLEDYMEEYWNTITRHTGTMKLLNSGSGVDTEMTSMPSTEPEPEDRASHNVQPESFTASIPRLELIARSIMELALVRQSTIDPVEKG